MIPIPAASADSPLLSSSLSLSASVPTLSFPTTVDAGEVRGGGSGSVVERGLEVVTGVGESRRYAAPSPAGDAPVSYGVDSNGDANGDVGGAVVGRVGRDGGGREGYYGREEENNDGNGGGKGGAMGVGGGGEGGTGRWGGGGGEGPLW